ncbi:MAG TPA: hypothetical protein VHT91_06925 [Kofleriaceae bacterium]|jgi:uncharacterized protein (DUF58 family)|nr:hypothetical protein [Kofleriaceae bacterium]
MVSRVQLRWVVAVGLLCGTAQPAFADGVPMDGWFGFLASLAIAGLVALTVVILLVRAIVLAIVNRREKPPVPEVPEARVVHDRSKPS